MRIALRTGGGRGVYELAGSQGNYKASDLFDKELFYEITPELIIPGRARADKRQGKPRIKLDDQKTTTHFYRLLAALLLLPKPKREYKTTTGRILIASEAYSITVVKIDLSLVELDRAIVRPTDILLANYDGLKQRVKFVDRMSRVLTLWKIADETDSELARLLRLHRDSLYSDDVDFKKVEQTTKNLLVYLSMDYDPLDYIETSLGINFSIDKYHDENDVLDSTFGLDDAKSLRLAKIENIKKWRKVAIRGSAASKFRSEIRELYKDTCLFSGQRLPKMRVTSSAGVDAAHILPWASYDINSVTNGLCLTKQCHWAFDSGVLRLSYDFSSNQYILDIPDPVVQEAMECGFDLDEYNVISGVIPKNRLPNSQELWPNPKFLQAYNELMFT